MSMNLSACSYNLLLASQVLAGKLFLIKRCRNWSYFVANVRRIIRTFSPQLLL